MYCVSGSERTSCCRRRIRVSRTRTNEHGYAGHLGGAVAQGAGDRPAQQRGAHQPGAGGERAAMTSFVPPAFPAFTLQMEGDDEGLERLKQKIEQDRGFNCKWYKEKC